MSCGCDSPCGCNVVGDHTTAEVVRAGDTFTVSAIHPIRDIEDTDCIDLSVDEETRTLRADLILADADGEATVQLECTDDGLLGHVILDPASTAIVSAGPLGVRVDIPPAEPDDGEGSPGDYLFFSGLGERANHVDADGSELQRDEYPGLWDALTLAGSAAQWTGGSDVVDGVTSASLLGPGIVIEAAGFVPGTTILEVLGVSQIRVSTDALADGVGELRAYPYGDGDGFSSFALPNMNRRLPVGMDHSAPIGTHAVGTTSGALDALIAEANLPSHIHTGAVVGSISVSTAIAGAGNVLFDAAGGTDEEPNHTHGTATAGRVFVEAANASFVNVSVDQSDVGQAYSIPVGGTGGTPALGQTTDGGTGGAGVHTHGVTASGAITGASIASVLALDDGDAAHDLDVTTDPMDAATPMTLPLPPHIVGRWMVHT